MTVKVYDALGTGELIMENPTYEQLERERDEWKELWLAEVYRGDHEPEETYTARELDRARQMTAGWNKSKDKMGNVTVEFQS